MGTPSHYRILGLGSHLYEASKIKKLCPDRGLKSLFVGQVVSQMGDSIYMIALMWLVLELTGSKAAMGTVAALSHLPILLFGLLGGVAADVYNRRRVMLAADAMRALVVLVLPLTMLYGTVNLGVIYGVTFVSALGIVFFNPARDAIVPELVPPSQLVKANSLIQSSHFAAMLLGPAVAALLLSAVDLVHLFTINAATFGISFGAILLIRYRPTGRQTAARKSTTGHLGEVVRYVFKERRLRFLLILTAINNFFIMGPAIVGTPIFVREILHQDVTHYAFVESTLGLGMIIGAILVNLAARSLGKGKLLLLGMLFDGVTYAVLYYCGTTMGLAALIAFHALGIPFIIVSRTALIQEWVPTGMQGRIFGLAGMAVVGTTAVSCGAVGFLAESIPINLIFGVFGICATLCGIVGYCYTKLRES